MAVEVASIVATGSSRDTIPATAKAGGIVTASEPFDVDEFLSTIYESRHAGSRAPTE